MACPKAVPARRLLLLPAAFGMRVEGRVEAHRGGYYTVHPASYTMRKGFSNPQSLSVRLARFEQLGGTNRVAGNLDVRQGWYNDNTVYALSGGLLVTSNSSANSYAHYPGTRGFGQSGGTHIVRGTLSLGGGSYYPYPGGYTLWRGKLIVRNIRMGGGAIFWQGAGNIIHSGVITLSGGHWQRALSASRTQHFGPLQLNAEYRQTNSTFTFATGAVATVRFAASAEMPWDSEARLIIQHWEGRPTGRGLHQIYFGINNNGLTSQQLSQIRFRDPKGLPTGEYPAQQRSTGEIVPTVSVLTDSAPVFRR